MSCVCSSDLCVQMGEVGGDDVSGSRKDTHVVVLLGELAAGAGQGKSRPGASGQAMGPTTTLSEAVAVVTWAGATAPSTQAVLKTRVQATVATVRAMVSNFNKAILLNLRNGTP